MQPPSEILCNKVYKNSWFECPGSFECSVRIRALPRDATEITRDYVLFWKSPRPGDSCASCAINIYYIWTALIQLLLIAGPMLFCVGVAASAAAKFTCSGPPGADATLRWGVVQLVGHLTVNEDGEG